MAISFVPHWRRAWMARLGGSRESTIRTKMYLIRTINWLPIRSWAWLYIVILFLDLILTHCLTSATPLYYNCLLYVYTRGPRIYWPTYTYTAWYGYEYMTMIRAEYTGTYKNTLHAACTTSVSSNTRRCQTLRNSVRKSWAAHQKKSTMTPTQRIVANTYLPCEN